MSDGQRAQSAFAMGNIGLWSQMRERVEVDDRTCDYDYEAGAARQIGDDVDRSTCWQRVRGPVLRWSLAAAIVLAYLDHWPEGH